MSHSRLRASQVSDSPPVSVRGRRNAPSTEAWLHLNWKMITLGWQQ